MDVATAGLSAAEAAVRLERHGPNALPDKAPLPLWRRFASQFRSPLIYVLVAALALDTLLWLQEGARGVPAEALSIGLILLLNATLGVYQEQRSDAALARLTALAAPLVWVMRDGRLIQTSSRDLVPGDLLRLEAGDRVPADGRLRVNNGIMLDESTLTGESVPVEAEADSEALSGTLVVRGHGYLEVERTGVASAMGRLASMLGSIDAARTPLERRLDVFGAGVTRAVVALAAGLVLAGVALEGPGSLPRMVVFAVALAVAAVPEGLPAVLTVTLALGVERMARRRAVVRRLAAVEALGSVTVIATDKTGTLTENRMDVRHVDAPDLDRALHALVLANDADLDTGAGDPLELGLLRRARDAGLDVADIRRRHVRRSMRPFDSEWKFMRVTAAAADGRDVSYVKGAADVVLPRCRLHHDERRSWEEKAHAYAAEGYRVLAAATGVGDAEHDLEWLGLVLFWDPPRPEVAEAIRRARAAGIRIVMITGDHPATALTMARRVGIEADRVLTGSDLERFTPEALHEAARTVQVFARVQPQHKLQLVEALAGAGEIVGVTGDGVNDAPALKRADVGVAMGQRGSDVSREVADLVLVDDNFATVVNAVEEGRSIYENIQKFLRFLFSTNLAEVLVVSLGTGATVALGLREADGSLLLPLSAVQILWINLVTDGFPAIVLALDRNPGVMQRPPRPPAAPLLDRPSLVFVVAAGVLTGSIALALFGGLWWFGHPLAVARSACFHVTAIAQLFLPFAARHTEMRPLQNAWLWVVMLAGVSVQVLMGSAPPLAAFVDAVPLSGQVWLLVFAAAAAAWVSAESVTRLVWSRTRRSGADR